MSGVKRVSRMIPGWSQSVSMNYAFHTHKVICWALELMQESSKTSAFPPQEYWEENSMHTHKQKVKINTNIYRTTKWSKKCHQAEYWKFLTSGLGSKTSREEDEEIAWGTGLIRRASWKTRNNWFQMYLCFNKLSSLKFRFQGPALWIWLNGLEFESELLTRTSGDSEADEAIPNLRNTILENVTMWTEVLSGVCCGCCGKGWAFKVKKRQE